MSGEIRVRPVLASDAEALHRIRTEPGVARFTGRLPSERLRSVEEYLAGLKPDDHLLVAELEGQVIGSAFLGVRSGKQRHVAWLGLMVAKNFEGRGVARRLMGVLLELADAHLALTRVELTVATENDRAIKLYESLGFAIEGTLRKAFIQDGQFKDWHIMGRVRD